MVRSIFHRITFGCLAGCVPIMAPIARRKHAGEPGLSPGCSVLV